MGSVLVTFRDQFLVAFDIADAIKRAATREAWETFDVLDAICELIAADGTERLARSNV
jgi:hypothetical protein